MKMYRIFDKITSYRNLFPKQIFLKNLNVNQNKEDIIINNKSIFSKGLLKNLIKNNKFDLLAKHNRKFKKEDIYYIIQAHELPIKTILYLYNEYDKEHINNGYSEYIKKIKIYEDIIKIIDNGIRKKLIDELIKLNNDSQEYVYIDNYNSCLKNYDYDIVNVNKEIKEYATNKLVENILLEKIEDTNKRLSIFNFEYYELTGKQFNELTKKKVFCKYLRNNMNISPRSVLDLKFLYKKDIKFYSEETIQGSYFVDKEHIYNHYGIDKNIYEVIIPDDAKIHIRFGMFSVDKIIIKKNS